VDGFPAPRPRLGGTIGLKPAKTCQQVDMVLNVEASSRLDSDERLLRLDEYAEHRQKLLAGHAKAEALRGLFSAKPRPE
jgi:hypothetical protein